jgi:hypothetical protein
VLAGLFAVVAWLKMTFGNFRFVYFFERSVPDQSTAVLSAAFSQRSGLTRAAKKLLLWLYYIPINKS